MNYSFGQENAVQGIIGAIGGNNGQAATLAGASIGTLLAGANACAKVRKNNRLFGSWKETDLGDIYIARPRRPGCSLSRQRCSRRSEGTGSGGEELQPVRCDDSLFLFRSDTPGYG